ncbi:MAG: sarcosine oxidase subunit gamma [Microgenomates group bacterium]
MSNAVSALGNVSFNGFAQISEIGPIGMISLRAKPDVKGLDKAVKAAVGTKVPGVRQMEGAQERFAGWMSPDEYLLVMPYADTGAAMAAIDKALKGQHYLAVVVSDARAVFRVTGEKADQVLAKLSPVDFANLGAQELRRTRAAQVAAAFWRDDSGYTLVCFRSVATYIMGLLSHSAMTGSEL